MSEIYAEIYLGPYQISMMERFSVELTDTDGYYRFIKSFYKNEPLAKSTTDTWSGSFENFSYF